MKVVKKICRWIFDIILFIILAIALIIAYNHIQINIKGNTYTTMLGYSAFEVATGSMSNTIEIGDVILVKLIEPNETLSENEIVVFTQDTTLVTHRIIKINGDQIITKGDANNTQDDPISRGQIIGKVVKIIPDVKMWKEIILTPKVLIPTSISILLLWIFFSYDKEKDVKKTKKVIEEQEYIDEEIESNEKPEKIGAKEPTKKTKVVKAENKEEKNSIKNSEDKNTTKSSKTTTKSKTNTTKTARKNTTKSKTNSASSKPKKTVKNAEEKIKNEGEGSKNKKEKP
ncbi:MAG TPA: signal peptidase I [Clostridiales bacterium]|nr:signal peptidase I [Clostridiales bacterium]